jgi:hypothetical protein
MQAATTTSRGACIPSHLLGLLLPRTATLILTSLAAFLSLDPQKCDGNSGTALVPSIVLILADDK